jgi:aminoglycoside 3-N-acetyltransferase
LTSALAALPLEPGDVLFCHSNLGFFGRMEGIGSAAALCPVFLEEMLARVAPGGTLVVPTFTYSFPRGEIFDPGATPSDMGVFSEWVRKQPNAIRSRDPCYSVAAIGADAERLAHDVSTNSFDDDSFFGRFARGNGKILNLNFDAGSTFVHFVERKLNVPYRFDKMFSGVIRENGVDVIAASTIWVRYLSDDALEAAFEGFDEAARAEGLFVVKSLGRGQLGAISALATSDLIARTIRRRPWFLTKAEKLGISTPRIAPDQS